MSFTSRRRLRPRPARRALSAVLALFILAGASRPSAAQLPGSSVRSLKWPIRTREHVDLWLHGFAMISGDSSPVPLFRRGYQGTLTMARTKANAVTDLDVNRDALAKRLRENPSLINAQFLVFSFQNWDDLVAAVDAFMTWSSKDAPLAETGPFPARATVATYVDQFDYLKRLVGIDHIGFGTDFISDIEAGDPALVFEFPPEMTNKQEPNIQYVEASREFPTSETCAPRWSAAATRPKRSRKFSAATGCASIARRGTPDNLEVSRGASASGVDHDFISLGEFIGP